jgi:hypothetical protein
MLPPLVRKMKMKTKKRLHNLRLMSRILKKRAKQYHQARKTKLLIHPKMKRRKMNKTKRALKNLYPRSHGLNLKNRLTS